MRMKIITVHCKSRVFMVGCHHSSHKYSFAPILQVKFNFIGVIMLTGSYSEEISAQSTWYRRTKLRFQYRALDFHIIIVVLLRMREKRVSCKRACVMLYLFATSVCYFQRAKKSCRVRIHHVCCACVYGSPALRNSKRRYSRGWVELVDTLLR